jgi:hypothetical protein
VSETDRNDLAFWFPKIQAAGLPVPRTEIVRTEVALAQVLDGETPDGWDAFILELRAAARRVRRTGAGVFLRTGHGSGKHQWLQTCYVLGVNTKGILDAHVARLVEWSALAGFFGLPTSTWAVREMLVTSHVCKCEAYGQMPVAREFRFFANDTGVTHWQPYWPVDAVRQGRPSDPDWEEGLALVSRLDPGERRELGSMARSAAAACGGGEWSVDFLQDVYGCWWLTDMAVGEDSFRYEPEGP